MHTKTIKIAVLLTCFASLSASANPIGDALGKIINWGQNTLHPADPGVIRGGVCRGELTRRGRHSEYLLEPLYGEANRDADRTRN